MCIHRWFRFDSSSLNFAEPNIRRLHGNRVADHGAKRTPSAVGATRPEVIKSAHLNVSQPEIP